ncbi:MAG: hypothetical protein R2851_09210 [Caldilineaceae bacterium]
MLPKPDDFDIIDERNPTGRRELRRRVRGGAVRWPRVGDPGAGPLRLCHRHRLHAHFGPVGTITPAARSGRSRPRPAPAVTNPVTATATITPPPRAPHRHTLPAAQTPTPACTIAVSETFAPLNPGAELGCATGAASIVWAAYEPFERGAMLWRSDTDDVYAIFDDGDWELVNEQWSGQEPTGRGTPPPGLVAPARGFGYVWNAMTSLRLGWARDAEKGFCAEKSGIHRRTPLPAATCRRVRRTTSSTLPRHGRLDAAVPPARGGRHRRNRCQPSASAAAGQYHHPTCGERAHLRPPPRSAAHARRQPG